MSAIKMSVVALAFATTTTVNAATATLLGWNNLGMHCMDSDYSVFSILPPYNTIEAQLIIDGKLLTNGGYTVTYQAVADPDGSFNSTAMGKGNFYTYAEALFGATLAPETGLAGWPMPGLSNIPQTMLFEQTNQPAPGVFTRVNWFRAEGIPISPYDDSHNKNAYPMMRLIARNAANQAIATNDIVLPVSDEMDCRACHASGTQSAAKPSAGWLWNGFPERDFRLNILRLHDERQFAENRALYEAALAARGFNPQGLYRGVVVDDKPVLCAACHASEALGAPSYGTIRPLTASMHSLHAAVEDPIAGGTLIILPIGLRVTGAILARQRVPPRRYGTGNCTGWLGRDAMSKLPRQHEHGRFHATSRLVNGTELPELSHRDSHGKQWSDSIYLRLQTNGSLRARERNLRHNCQHAG
jgi:cytochrome c5